MIGIIVMINNTIEYDEARFHERHDSVILCLLKKYPE